MDKQNTHKLSKLTKTEWTFMEKPVTDKEKAILAMIKNSFHSEQVIYLYHTISSLVKLDHDEKDYYIYTVLLKDSVDQMTNVK